MFFLSPLYHSIGPFRPVYWRWAYPTHQPVQDSTFNTLSNTFTLWNILIRTMAMPTSPKVCVYDALLVTFPAMVEWFHILSKAHKILMRKGCYHISQNIKMKNYLIKCVTFTWLPASQKPLEAFPKVFLCSWPAVVLVCPVLQLIYWRGLLSIP